MINVITFFLSRLEGLLNSWGNGLNIIDLIIKLIQRQLFRNLNI
jgi:hypothetical protein